MHLHPNMDYKDDISNSSDEDLEFSESKSDDDVKVMVRCRPLQSNLDHDKLKNLKILEDLKIIEIGERQFLYDSVFGPNATNETIYLNSVRQLVDYAFKGYNCTVFLYGQTGTGKTYTHSSLTGSAFSHLFSLIEDSNSHQEFLISASYCELYNEEIRDLLSNSNKKLELHELQNKEVYIKGLSCFLVSNLKDIEKLKDIGDKHRATGSTKMNAQSSRSHSIFTIKIETVDHKSIQKQGTAKKTSQPQNTELIRVGRIHLVDLAGSERQAKSGSSGLRLKEASSINLSLTCLSSVIRALTDNKSTHVPYRNSKLTRLLSSSLGGNSKTLLLACISPAKYSLDETLNTLRFASRAKKMKNDAQVNENENDALLRKYRLQIQELRNRLKATEEDTLRLINSAQSYDIKQLGIESQLLEQLKFLKNKIMFGGENLLEKAELHEKLLKSSKIELDKKRKQEQKLKQKLEKKQDVIKKMRESRNYLGEQMIILEDKIEKAEKIEHKFRNEFQDLAAEHSSLKEDLLVTIKEINKEVRYADCLIDDYLPKAYRTLVESHAYYDEETEEWQIKYIALSGNNINMKFSD